MTPLIALIRHEITVAGGWIGFDRFMELALYAPGLGYYTGGSSGPFGAAGDFVTAPMLGPWLSHSISNWCRPLADQQGLVVREFGAGLGDLAAGLLSSSEISRYEVIELSANLKAKQQKRTAGLSQIVWKQSLEPDFSGLVLANEVLDAMPVKCFQWAGGDRVLEWGVALSSEADPIAEQQDAMFCWAARAATSDELIRDVLDRRDQAQWRGLPWDPGHRGEWSPWFGPWIKSLHDSMRNGAVLLIDYGHAASELDHVSRRSGTLCAHYRHQRIDEPDELLVRVGQQDLTAHVNFSSLAKCAQAAGFDVRGFVTQGAFLINTGLLEHAQELIDATEDEVQKSQLRASLKRLVTPSGMGESFKVMLLTKALAPEVVTKLGAAFSFGDQQPNLG